jgi:hypothetical protein
MSNCEEKKNQEMRLLFKLHIEDLRYCKKQQWHMLYLTLIGIGALISVGRLLGDACLKCALIVCSWFIVLIGSVFLFVYYASIKDFRDKKGKIANTFEPDVKKISGIPAGEDRDSNNRDLIITIVFVAICVVAAVLATLMI